MRTPKALVGALLATGLLASAPVFAGSFSTDFSPGSTGYTLAGTGTTPGGYLTNYLGVNRAVLAPAVAGNSGSVTVGDFDLAQTIESFVANFQIQMGPGSGNAADGVSFNFGPNVTDGLVTTEEGPGGGALTISFDIYDNGVANERGAPSTPALDILYNGVVVASHAYAKADMVTSKLEDVSVRLTRNGNVSVVYKGQIVHTNVFIPGWAPTYGLFNFSARSGGEYCEQEIANLSINTVLKGADVAPTIVTPPASATVNEGGSTNFTVVVDGTAPFSFQWTDNGADIPGETGTTLTMRAIPYTENGHQIRVRVSNPANPTGVTSAAATLTVIRDTTPPTVISANADRTGTMVTVVYSEAVSDTAVDLANYSIDQGVNLSWIQRRNNTDPNAVIIHTVDPMPGGFSYKLSIHGVQDMASSPPNTIAATQVTFLTYLYQVGAIIHKKYVGFGDTGGLGALQNDPRYPNNPDRQEIVTRFEYPPDGVGRDCNLDPNGNNCSTPNSIMYSDTLECMFIPPSTNDYVFYAAGADENDVYLSTDEDPANMVQIAHVVNWTNARGWMQPQCGAGDTNGLRSDWYSGNMWAFSGDPTIGTAYIHLDGGKKYYLFAVHHRFSWSGADDFGVTFKTAGNPPPSVGDAPLLTGSVVGNYLDPTGASVTFSQQPTNVTVIDGRMATFTGLATGQSIYGTTVTYQWQTAPKGSSTFTNVPGATQNSLTTVPLHLSDDGRQFRLLAMVAGLSQPSSVATVTVTADNTPPTVITANPDEAATQVIVVYSEAVTDTALTLSNYGIDQGVTISGITRMDASRVILATSQMAKGATYNLSVHGVQDLATVPNTIVATVVPFKTYVLQAGAVLHKKYNGFNDGNGNLDALKADPRYPNWPDRQDVMTVFEYPAGGVWRDATADPIPSPRVDYSDTLECYFIPPVTTNYVFFATGSDINDVYLSTDADPAHMVNIAQVSGWTNPRDWLVSQCGTTNGLRSDWYTGNAWPGRGDPATGSALIQLTGGQKYYLFAFHHRFSWSGGDVLSVTYSYAGAPAPASGDVSLLSGSVVGADLDPTGSTITFSQQPADAIIFQDRKATFTAVVTAQSPVYGGTATLQWQTAPSGSTTFTNIPGATAASYTTPVLGLADTGRQYKLIATLPGLTQASRVAIVTVNVDNVPPKLVAASALASQTNTTFDVGVTFDEPVDAVSAGTLANYAVSAGTLMAVKYYDGSPGVVLTVTNLAVGQSYSVTVMNVGDVYGNHMSSANLPFTVSTMKWGVVGGDELKLGNGVLAVAPNSFDIYSDSIGEWGAYDEATLVYEQVAGDFDKELRVEFVDTASQWARAGLIARDVTNFGVDRNGQTTNSLAGRYQKVHVQPVTTAMGTGGANDYECNRRLTTGGATDNTSSSGTPHYPTAWCRLQRVGQTFNTFRSDDGVNWVAMGSTTWPATNSMPDTLYVGPEYAPELGNVTTDLQRVFVAKFRDYRDHAGARPALSVTRNPDGTFTLIYTGTLVSSPTVNGTYNAVSGASSPWTINPKATSAPATQFYRAQQ